jgi:hypothetical protein
VTAVPGTRAFVSTSTHPIALFTGSSVSYDAGQTWTHIDQTAQKAVCRFFDANTGYAGGFHLSGHPVLRHRGIFKSQIVFDVPASEDEQTSATRSGIVPEKISKSHLLKVYPLPANDVINVFLDESFLNNNSVISLFNVDGRLIESKKAGGSKLMQVGVSKLPAGLYILSITNRSQTVNKIISIKR